MNTRLILPNRRQMVSGMAAGCGALCLPGWLARPGLFAEELTLTPAMTEGPFYPDRLPLDTDNDLLIINDAITPAVGEITHLSGRILNRHGNPVPNALVEIWQVDSNGSYLHSRGGNPHNANRRDANFQGYGRFLTNRKGEYYFRTIKPVVYPGRTPHIHYAVSLGDRRLLATQLLIRDDPRNEADGLFRQISDPKLRQRLVASFDPLPDSGIGELTANFDIVVGVTPEDDPKR